MPLTRNSPIIGPTTGMLSDVVRYAADQGAKRLTDTTHYLSELFLLGEKVGIDASLAAAQSSHEANVWRSPIWVSDLNPSGIGITDGGKQGNIPYSNGADAARAHLIHLWVYAKGLPLHPLLEPYKHLDGRINNVVAAGYAGKATTLGYLTGRWATDPQYADGILRHHAAIFRSPVSPTPPKEDPIMGYPPRVTQSITPMSAGNRPGLAMPSPSWITVHEVGNLSPGANAEMHRRFVNNGGGPGGVSFHFVVDQTDVFQLIPLDEAAWHASDGYSGTGNRDSVAIETVQIGDFLATLRNLAWLIAEIITNPTRFYREQPAAFRPDFSDQRIAQHNHWAPDKKNCPQFIRDRGLWDDLMRMVDVEIAKRGGGSSPPDPKPTGPTYANPVVYPWLVPAEADDGIDRAIGDAPVYFLRQRYQAVTETPRRQGTGTNRAVVGPPIKKGEGFFADYVYRSGSRTYVLTSAGTRVQASDLSPRVSVSESGTITVKRQAA